MLTRKTVLAIFLVTLSLCLFGCDELMAILGLGDAQLVCSGFSQSTDSITGAFKGVSITVDNKGGKDAQNVEFLVVVTTSSEKATKLDTVIYKGTISSILRMANQLTTVSDTDISTYTTSNSVSVGDGKYYFGVVLDPDGKITQSDTTWNNEVSESQTWFVGSRPMAGVIRGNLTIPNNLQYYDQSDVKVNVPAGPAVSYSIYSLAVPTDVTSLTSLSAVPGLMKFSIQYLGPAVGDSVVTYIIGIPSWDSYYGVIFMDVNGNGQFDLRPSVSPGEPNVLWPAGSGGPTYTPVAHDEYADLTLGSP